MIKKIIFIIIFILAGTIAGVLLKQKYFQDPFKTQDHLHVVASFYPIGNFAKQVGGEHTEIITITPGGSEPHDYESSPQDIRHILAADLFLLNGAGLDRWADKLLPELEKNTVPFRVMADHIDLIHKSGQPDPHFWIDPIFAQKEVEIIRDALVEIDPDHRDDYVNNAASYLEQITELDILYQSGLSSCNVHDIIVAHDSFSYLGDRYGFSIIPIAGLSHDDEPSAKAISEISKTAQEKHIHYIFFETLASPKLSETIAQEVGAQTLLLNPIEGLVKDASPDSSSYLLLMKENLQQLQIAMECEQ